MCLTVFRYYYRAIATEHPKGRVIAGDIIVAFMWYWILYHMWYEPEHLFVSMGLIYMHPVTLFYYHSADRMYE